MKPIKVGVVGLGRGISFASGPASVQGFEVVALCDTWEERLRPVGRKLGVQTYTDFDTFLDHDMDAVVLANYFHQHAPFAIKALEAGKHVLSETSACKTLAEGVELIEAVERSGCTYMLAENYPYMVFNQEMRRLYEAGEVGELRYAEGEYVHPFPAAGFNSIAPGENHWRNWIPIVYYCTHALAPVMQITGLRPVKVNGFMIPYDYGDPELRMTARRGDPAGVLMCRMENGAVVKVLQGKLRGEGTWVRIHGNKGLMENLRTGPRHMVRVYKEHWEKADGEPREQIYAPDFPTHHHEATQAGHGGGDFFVTLRWAEAIRTGEPPDIDVYKGVAMSIAGVLGYRSALADGAPEEIPDLRDSAARDRYRDDRWSPDPEDAGPGQPPLSVLGEITPTPEGLEFARKCWQNSGQLLYAGLFKDLLQDEEEEEAEPAR